MSGIKVSVKTKAKETLKLSNHLRSYLFEQEYGELSNCTPVQKKTACFSRRSGIEQSCK